MNEKKLCPLKNITSQSTKEQAFAFVIGDEEALNKINACDGPLCAWWDAERSCCGVVAGR